MNQKAIESVYPLAPAQQGLLLRILAEPDPAAQVDQSCGTLAGPIDIRALEKAWQWAADRHPMLRTAFIWRNIDQPMQAVLPRAPVPFQYHDWRDLGEQEQHAHFMAFLEADRSQAFTLSEPPLMRFTLIRTQDDAHRLVWSRHRVLLDGWSVAVLKREIDVAYHAFAQGHAAPDGAPGTSYGDYVAWLGRQDWMAAEAFWRTTLHGIKNPTPLGRVIPAAAREANPDFRTVTGKVETSLAEALAIFARKRRFTLNTLVQGAWAILLSHYSGRLEVVFGTTVAGRPAALPGVGTTLGLFTNSLPLRVEVSPETRLDAWLAALQARHLELREYEYCSAGQVHGWSEIAGAHSLYESVLVFQNYPASLPGIGGDASDAASAPGAIQPHSDYPLTIHIDADLRLALVFDTARLDRADVERMLFHITSVLEQFVAKPDARIEAVANMIPATEIPSMRSPPTGIFRTPGTFVAPRTDIEGTMVRIWEELLGIPEIGIDDNFFAMRGHSLLAMRLISRIRDAFQVEVPLGRIYATPTISGLSQEIEGDILAQLEALSEEEARALVGNIDSQSSSAFGKK
jgi:acyl carrier protein